MNKQALIIMPESVADPLKFNKLSDKYQVIKTHDVAQIMREQGFIITQANTLKPRNRDPRVVKHFLRLRHQSHETSINGTIPEIVLINSHDGSTSLRMEAGLFRMICSNGLIVKSASIYSSRTRHIDVTETRVVEEADKVIRAALESARRIELFMNKTLSDVDAKDFAMQAIQIRSMPNVTPEAMLQVRRQEDAGNKLWNVFNRVQENLMRGGIQGVSTNGRRVTTQGVRAMGPTVKVNTRLWELAEEFV